MIRNTKKALSAWKVPLVFVLSQARKKFIIGTAVNLFERHQSADPNVQFARFILGISGSADITATSLQFGTQLFLRQTGSVSQSPKIIANIQISPYLLFHNRLTNTLTSIGCNLLVLYVILKKNIVRDTGQNEAIMESVLKELIEHHEVNIFYVGNHGRFDNICRSVLKDLKMVYPQIYYSVVLAYMPGQRKSLDFRDYSDTIYPDGLERVPPKVAICARNDWMLSRSDFVVTYVCSITGGAATYKEKSLKKGKTVIELFKREI